jgi:N-hydroxyarylamine O-acetyltransferase
MFDLDAYLARVGYDGPRAPTLALLRDLTAAHTQSIPFENLDVLLGRRIDLALDAVFDKLVRQRRGGYCFEQNSLFLHVLTALGFEARPLSARVRIDRPRDYTPPRTHMFVRVELEGASWLTDVGVGALSLTAPLRFGDGLQETPHEPRRLVREGDRWFHQARLGDDFLSRLIVARAAPGGRRITLLNRELKLRDRDGHAERRALDSPQTLLAVLAEQFGLHFPKETRFGSGAAPWPT